MENAVCRITINGQHTGLSLRTVPAPRNQSGAIQRAAPPHMLPAQGAAFNGPSQVSSASRRKPQRYGRYPLTHSGASRLKAFFQEMNKYDPVRYFLYYHTGSAGEMHHLYIE